MKTKELESIPFIDEISQIQGGEVKRLHSNLIVWKEASSYDHHRTHEQFDELERLISEQSNENLNYLVDLSLASRPDPETVEILEKRLELVSSSFRHVAVYTGRNYLIFLGIKFYFIKFKFKSYTVHTTLESALSSFKK